MSRLSLLPAAAVVIALSALAACAGRSDDASPAPVAESRLAAPAAAPTPPSAAAPTPAPAQPGVYTDVQLRSFVAASTQIEPISQSLATATPEQRTAATAEIRTILQTNNITADQYNAIATQARTDAELSARITALQAPADAPQ